MFEEFLGRKFKSKCGSLIRITKTRVVGLKRKKVAVQKYMKQDISDLISLNLNPYSKADSLLFEMNMASCYDFIHQFCDCISNNLSDMNKHSECPEECKEPVSSLIFAAARFAEFPELRDLRQLFTQKYGNSLDCFSNREFVEKTNRRHATDGTKIQLIRDIAKEFSLEWDSEAIESSLHKINGCGDDEREKRRGENAVGAKKDEGVESNANGRWVRRGSLKLPPNKPGEGASKVGLRKSRRSYYDEGYGERMLDELLDHFSSQTGSSSYQTRQVKCFLKPTRSGHHRKSSSVVPPIKPESLLLDSDIPNGTPSRKGHVRAVSMHPDMHVHPNLPDYDDLAARLKALKKAYH